MESETGVSGETRTFAEADAAALASALASPDLDGIKANANDTTALTDSDSDDSGVSDLRAANASSATKPVGDASGAESSSDDEGPAQAGGTPRDPQQGISVEDILAELESELGDSVTPLRGDRILGSLPPASQREILAQVEAHKAALAEAEQPNMKAGTHMPRPSDAGASSRRGSSSAGTLDSRARRASSRGSQVMETPSAHGQASVALAPLGSLWGALSTAGGGMLEAASEFTGIIVRGGNTNMTSPLSLHRKEDPHALLSKGGEGGVHDSASTALGAARVPVLGRGLVAHRRGVAGNAFMQPPARGVSPAAGLAHELNAFGQRGHASVVGGGGDDSQDEQTGVLRLAVLGPPSANLLRSNAAAGQGYGHPTAVAAGARFIAVGTTRSLVLVYTHDAQKPVCILSRSQVGSAAGGARSATDKHVTSIAVTSTLFGGGGFMSKGGQRLELAAVGYGSGRVTVYDIVRSSVLVDVEPSAPEVEGSSQQLRPAPIVALSVVSGWAHPAEIGVLQISPRSSAPGTGGEGRGDDAARPALLATDARGRVQVHTLDTGVFGGWKCDTNTLFSGAGRMGPILAQHSILPCYPPSQASAAHAARQRGAYQVQLLQGGGRTGGSAGQNTDGRTTVPVTDIASMAQAGTLVALARPSGTQVISLGPPLHVCWNWAPPPNVPPGVPPVLAWGRARVRGSRVQRVLLPAFAATPGSGAGAGHTQAEAARTHVPSVVGVATTFPTTVLARAWGSHLQLVQVQPRGGFGSDFTTPYFASTGEGGGASSSSGGRSNAQMLELVLGNGPLWFVPTDDLQCARPIVHLVWVGECQLAYVTSDAVVTVLDTVELKELDEAQLSHVALVQVERLQREFAGAEAVAEEWGGHPVGEAGDDKGPADHSSVHSGTGGGSDAPPSPGAAGGHVISPRQSLATSVFADGFGKVFLLGQNSVHVLSCQSWRRRVQLLSEGAQWMSALALAQDEYVLQCRDAALQLALVERRLRAGRPGGVLTQQEEQRLRDLRSNPLSSSTLDETASVLVRYVSNVVEHPPDALSKGVQGGDSTGLAGPFANYSKEFISHWRMQAAVCVDYCVGVGALRLLFEDIFVRFTRAGRVPQGLFLETLEPYILNDRILTLDAPLMKALVSHYAAVGNVAAVERCLLHLNLSTLDVDSTMKMCLQHRLLSALVAVFQRGLRDPLSPIDVLLCACVPEHSHVPPGTRIPVIPLAMVDSMQALVSQGSRGGGHAPDEGPQSDTHRAAKSSLTLDSILAEIDKDIEEQQALRVPGSRRASQTAARRRAASSLSTSQLPSGEAGDAELDAPVIESAADAAAAQLFLYLFHTLELREFPWGSAVPEAAQQAVRNTRSRVVHFLLQAHPDPFPCVGPSMRPAVPRLIGEKALGVAPDHTEHGTRRGRTGSADSTSSGHGAFPADPCALAAASLPGPYPRLQGLGLASLHGLEETLDAMGGPMLQYVHAALHQSLMRLLQQAPVASGCVLPRSAVLEQLLTGSMACSPPAGEWAHVSPAATLQAWAAEESVFVYRHVLPSVARGVAAQQRAVFGAVEYPWPADPRVTPLAPLSSTEGGEDEHAPILRALPPADAASVQVFMTALEQGVLAYLPPPRIHEGLTSSTDQTAELTTIARFGKVDETAAGGGGASPGGAGGAAPKRGWRKARSLLGAAAKLNKNTPLWEHGSGPNASEDGGAPLYLLVARVLAATPRPYPFPAPRATGVFRGGSKPAAVGFADAVRSATAASDDTAVVSRAGVQAYGVPSDIGSTVARVVFNPPEPLLLASLRWLSLRAAVFNRQHGCTPEDDVFRRASNVMPEHTVNPWKLLLLRVLHRCPPLAGESYDALLLLVRHPSVRLPRVEALLCRLDGRVEDAIAAYLRHPDRVLRSHALVLIRDEALCAAAEVEATRAWSRGVEGGAQHSPSGESSRTDPAEEVSVLGMLGSGGAGGAQSSTPRGRLRGSRGARSARPKQLALADSDTSDSDSDDADADAPAARPPGRQERQSSVLGLPGGGIGIGGLGESEGPSARGEARLGYLQRCVMAKLSALVQEDADGTARVVVERFPNSADSVLRSLQNASDGREYEFKYLRQVMQNIGNKKSSRNNEDSSVFGIGDSAEGDGSPTHREDKGGGRGAGEGGTICFDLVPSVGGDMSPLPPLGYDAALLLHAGMTKGVVPVLDAEHLASVSGIRLLSLEGGVCALPSTAPLTVGFTPAGLELCTPPQKPAGVALAVGSVAPREASGAGSHGRQPSTGESVGGHRSMSSHVSSLVSSVFGGAAARDMGLKAEHGTPEGGAAPPLMVKDVGGGTSKNKGVFGLRSMKQLMESSSLTITPDLHLRYIELLCVYKPEEVLPYLRAHSGYPPEQVLGIVQRKGRPEATAFLLEHAQAPLHALSVLTRSAASALGALGAGRRCLAAQLAAGLVQLQAGTEATAASKTASPGKKESRSTDSKQGVSTPPQGGEGGLISALQAWLGAEGPAQVSADVLAAGRKVLPASAGDEPLLMQFEHSRTLRNLAGEGVFVDLLLQAEKSETEHQEHAQEASFDAQLQHAIDLCQRNSDSTVLLAGSKSVRDGLSRVSRTPVPLLGDGTLAEQLNRNTQAANADVSMATAAASEGDTVYGALLWFALLDSLVLLQAEQSAACEPLEKFRGFESSILGNSSAEARASETAQALAALRGGEETLREATIRVLEEMRRVLPLDVVLEKVLRQYGSRGYGSFRDTIQGLLGSYGYELSILQTAEGLISADVYARIKELHARRGRGVPSGTPGTYAGGAAQLLRCGLPLPTYQPGVGGGVGGGDGQLVVRAAGVSCKTHDETARAPAVASATIGSAGVRSSRGGDAAEGGAGGVAPGGGAVAVVRDPLTGRQQLQGAGEAFATPAGTGWGDASGSALLTLLAGLRAAEGGIPSGAGGGAVSHRGRTLTESDLGLGALLSETDGTGAGTSSSVLVAARARNNRSRPLSELYQELLGTQGGVFSTIAALDVDIPVSGLQRLGGASGRRGGGRAAAVTRRMSSAGCVRGAIETPLG